MGRLSLALNVLVNGMPKITFDLGKATAIFNAARGRYAGDETKAVPFAILQTAKAMGAEVTLFVEAKERKAEIAASVKEAIIRAENATTDGKAEIARLEEAKRAIEAEIATVTNRMTARTLTLNGEAEAITAVETFFKIK